MTTFTESLWIGLFLGAIYSLLAFGFSFIYRSSGVLNFAHGILVVLASYILTTLLGDGWGWAAPLAGLAVGGLLGGVLYLGLFRPLLNRGHLILISTTLACLFIVTGLVQLIWGVTGRTLGALGNGVTHLPGGVLNNQDFYTIVFTVVAFCLLAPAIQWTTLGRTIHAVADDPVGARCVGINNHSTQLIAAVVGGALAGLAGALITPAHGVNVLEAPDFTNYAIAGAILGGSGSTWGAAAGGLLLGLVGGFASGYAAEWLGVIQYGVVLLVLRIAPNGLLGGRRGAALAIR